SLRSFRMLEFLQGCWICLRLKAKGFNAEKLDGELYRLPSVETLYKRKFIRSRPLFSATGYLWKNPKASTGQRLTIAYVLGVYWQENYVKDKLGVAYLNLGSAIRAYEQGDVMSFLAVGYVVGSLVKENKISPPPLREQRVFIEPLYHYLGIEFEPFMQQFSAYLDTHDPFGRFESFYEGAEEGEIEGPHEM
ncbi:hypothetical protein O4H49_18600, partial [Kiloniella laminariae]